jgi:isobutyryl-CoA mutase
LWARNGEAGKKSIEHLQAAAIKNQNLFVELMEAVKYCTLGQITNSMFEVGGQYRRSM